MDCPNETFESPMPWKGALAALIWSPGLGHIQRRRFSRPMGREPEGGDLANLACKKHHLDLV
jgi:hypothetical protein